MFQSIETINLSKEFTYFKDTFKDILLNQLTFGTFSDEIHDVLRFLTTVSRQTKLHTVFTAAGLEGLIATVFENVTVRDFILNLTDRFFITISSSSLNTNNKLTLVDHIKNGLSDYSSTVEYDSYSLIPEDIRNDIAITDLDLLLIHNNWLITVVLCLFTYPEIEESFKNIDLTP